MAIFGARGRNWHGAGSGRCEIERGNPMNKETLWPIDVDDGRPECQRQHVVEKVTER